MTDVVIKKVNEVHMHVGGDYEALSHISENFRFFVDGAKFSPKYKMGVWDGYIRMYNTMTGLMYAGLLEELLQFCELHDYSVSVDEDLKHDKNIPDDAASHIAKALDTNPDFVPRYYQSQAVAHALRERRAFIISPTASGKSFIIYLISRYYEMKKKRVLIVLPSVGLVKQIHGDFEEYAEGGRTLDTHMIAEGSEKDTEAPIVMSTWQSIYKQPAEWFAQFDTVIGDEADEFTADSLKQLMERCKEVPNRFGFTGTLEDCKVDRLVLSGLYGPIKQFVTTKQLQDEGTLADLTVNCIILKHRPEDIKAYKKSGKGGKKPGYAEEVTFLEGLHRRNVFIRNLASKLKGNTLTLFTHIQKHGNVLKPMLEEKGHEVHYVHGKVDADIREKIRKIVENSDNAKILGSYGTFSRGTNIKKLDNLIFAIAYKSKKRVLQSIGRILRKSKDDDHTQLYDIVDDLRSGKSNENFSLKHFKERMQTYAKEGFKVKIIEVEL